MSWAQPAILSRPHTVIRWADLPPERRRTDDDRHGGFPVPGDGRCEAALRTSEETVWNARCRADAAPGNGGLCLRHGPIPSATDLLAVRAWYDLVGADAFERFAR